MKFKKVAIFTIFSIILLSINFGSIAIVSAEDSVSINIKPEDVLFDIDNMKPGDWAPRTVIILNNGEDEFEYQMRLQNNGTDKLFNELLLEISDTSEDLYNGKLADFKELSSRNLEPSSNEELDITVRFPEHLGNEFQGLDAQFSFIFTAEGKENQSDAASVEGNVDSGGESNSGGSLLPDTATNMFNFLIIGVMLLVGGGLILIYKKVKNINKQRA